MSSKGENKKINTPLRVREVITIESGGRKYVFEGNSPTPTFINHVVGEATLVTKGEVVRPITYLSVCDSARSYCMDITGGNLNRQHVSSTSIRVSGTGTWNSSSQPAITELGYIGTNNQKVAYFTTTLTGDLSIRQGAPLSVTWDASLSLQITSASGFMAGSAINATLWIARLCDILIGSRPTGKYLTLTKSKGVGYIGVTTQVIWTTDTVRNQQAYKVGIYNFKVGTSGDLREVHFGDDDFSAAIVFSLPTPLTVKASDYVTIELTFQAA